MIDEENREHTFPPVILKQKYQETALGGMQLNFSNIANSHPLHDKHRYIQLLYSLLDILVFFFSYTKILTVLMPWDFIPNPTATIC